MVFLFFSAILIQEISYYINKIIAGIIRSYKFLRVPIACDLFSNFLWQYIDLHLQFPQYLPNLQGLTLI